MRIAITGQSSSAQAITAGLIQYGYAVGFPSSSAYHVDIASHNSSDVIVDGIDCPLESHLVTAIAECLQSGRVVLQRGGGVQDERRIRITVPLGPESQLEVERGVLRGFMRLIPLPVAERPKPTLSGWFKSLFAPAILLALTVPASAQVQINPQSVTFPVPQHVIVDTAPTTAVTGTFWQATQPVSIASMPSTPVTGTFWQATQPVSGTFWQATQPISGTVTANAGSGTFTISGTVTANAGSGTLAVSGPLTDAQLRASAVPVSGSGSFTVAGSVTANAGTNLNTSALALESGGNLASVKTNTDPLVAAGGGGYVRQDSTATIAKESGGNLATLATLLASIVQANGTTADTSSLENGGVDALGNVQPLSVAPGNLLRVEARPPVPSSLLLPCNPLRRVNCR